MGRKEKGDGMSDEQVVYSNFYLKPDGKIYLGEKTDEGTYLLSPTPVTCLKTSRMELGKFIKKIEVTK